MAGVTVVTEGFPPRGLTGCVDGTGRPVVVLTGHTLSTHAPPVPATVLSADTEVERERSRNFTLFKLEKYPYL